jgi:AraC family transcriptional regulator
MHQPPDILTLAYKQPFMQEQLVLLDEKERQIPGSVQYVYAGLRRILNGAWKIPG